MKDLNTMTMQELEAIKKETLEALNLMTPKVFGKALICFGMLNKLIEYSKSNPESDIAILYNKVIDINSAIKILNN